ncbi:type VI secretion system-associated FHA domain protein TagH [Vibrio sp. S11_S32]|uniref:type VI secretion system-associated FHA domain protein TagH n=1 Tax=Vibrio sp. S11_S32 TaxID=2720225 RepID=UPI0016811892|nr:type VI secretion system-associated FHA domain protein TagH [Vibrio sp. S11_S32]MBD1575459.1 type VI secretion system-associated FHA domain protein TagH [Vibrio sp. S11_S32]
MEEQLFLTFVVMNTRLLKTGGAASFQFKQQGGFIGNDDTCHWVLPDPNNALITPYCQITFSDKQYHLVDLQGGIGINNQEPKFEQNNTTLIRNGDVFRIGSYQIKAHVKMVEVEVEMMHEYQASSQQSIQTQQTSQTSTTQSYIPQLDMEVPAAKTTPIPSAKVEAPTVTQAAVSNSETPPETAPTTSIEVEVQQSSVHKEQSMTATDSQTVTDVKKQSLQACLQGLLAIHQRQDSQFHLLNRSFQPIQDNPLQMGLGLEETEEVMFGGEKSLFHLEPAQAISESLKSVESHNERVHKATATALQYILNELSPDTLKTRFDTYRKNAPANVDADAWAWKMYQSYFSELTSGRQKGFEKQFWEVLEQSYDSLQRQGS